jgi:hypothetical protein
VKRFPTGARLFAGALLVYSLCPPFSGYDSYYVVPTALSVLGRGETTVDPYVPAAPPASRYAVECVAATGESRYYFEAEGCLGGHWYNYFSPGVPALATPLIALIRAGVSVFGALFPRAAAEAPHPLVVAFLSGDLIGGRAVVELLCAAFFGALAVLVQYAILRKLLPEPYAVGVTLIFAFGTSEWSIASRSLTQHGLSILLLSLAILLAILARERPSRIALAGIPIALSFTVRPSNAITVVVFTLFVAIHYRRELWRFLACAAPIAIAFLVYNLHTRHALFSRYYDADSPEQHPPLLGFAMHWISPSRGVLMFTPVFLFSLAAIVLAIRRRWLFPLSPYLAAILVLHSLLISRYWGGHSYGPRYFSDVTPIFILFLAAAVRFWLDLQSGALRTASAGAFLALAAWGVFVHARGATSVAANQWSAVPISVDKAKWRVWDWRDPQFLRGLR